MHLVPHDAVAALVNAIDDAIDADAPTQHPAPVMRGTVEEFEDWATPGSTLIRHITPGGVPSLRNIPSHFLTPKVRRAFYRLFTAIEEAEEATPSDAPVRA